MELSHHDLKLLVYVAETLFGVVLVVAGWHYLSLAGDDLLGYGVSGLVLVVLGLFEILFGFETYVLRGELDIWD